MAERTPSNLLNVALVGHGGVGKTTFVDHLLHVVGFANRAGDVDAGSSLSDYEVEEQERKFSINSALFHFEFEGRAFNLVDTPGYPDFVGAAVGILPVVETAVICISAREGIQLNTRNMWAAAGREGLARIILLTRMDGDNVDMPKVVEDIHAMFGNQCRPVFLPIGAGQGVKGVVNLLEAEEEPPDVDGDFDAAREAALESVIESNDELMERYFEGEKIGADEIAASLRQAVASGSLVPILCCAAKTDVGVREAAHFLAACAPAPTDMEPRVATGPDGDDVLLPADPAGPFCARVFKATTDVHVGKVACFRVYSGQLRGDLTVQLARTGKPERLGHIYLIKGEDSEETDYAVPGDLLCVTKVEELRLDDTLCDSARLTVKPTAYPTPMMALAVGTQSRDDDQKVAQGLQSLAEGDPTFSVGRGQGAELVITGMSNLHVDVMLSRLKRRHGVAVETHEPAIAYRETVTRVAEGKHRHKKQTGGRGQFGEVYLRVEPNERGAGFEFIDEIVGGSIPRQYIPAIEKGIREVLDRGILAGCQIVDVKAAVYDGSFHTVDSSEAAFKIAGGRAFQGAFEQAKPVLLEPMALIEVTIPSQFMGDVTGNLTGHRGRILGMDQVGTLQVVKAEIPRAEVTRYSTELKSMTGGEGSFTLEFSHYAVVPANIQQDIIARHQKAKEGD
jgi:elongation factor G